MLGGCATQACAVRANGKTPLQWAEENKAPPEVISLVRAASDIDLGQWEELVAREVEGGEAGRVGREGGA